MCSDDAPPFLVILVGAAFPVVDNECTIQTRTGIFSLTYHTENATDEITNVTSHHPNPAARGLDWRWAPHAMKMSTADPPTAMVGNPHHCEDPSRRIPLQCPLTSDPGFVRATNRS